MHYMKEQKRTKKANDIVESLKRSFAQRNVKLNEVTLNDLVPEKDREK